MPRWPERKRDQIAEAVVGSSAVAMPCRSSSRGAPAAVLLLRGPGQQIAERPALAARLGRHRRRRGRPPGSRLAAPGVGRGERRRCGGGRDDVAALARRQAGELLQGPQLLVEGAAHGVRALAGGDRQALGLGAQALLLGLQRGGAARGLAAQVVGGLGEGAQLVVEGGPHDVGCLARGGGKALGLRAQALLLDLQAGGGALGLRAQVVRGLGEAAGHRAQVLGHLLRDARDLGAHVLDGAQRLRVGVGTQALDVGEHRLALLVGLLAHALERRQHGPGLPVRLRAQALDLGDGGLRMGGRALRQLLDEMAGAALRLGERAFHGRRVALHRRSVRPSPGQIARAAAPRRA